MTLCKIKNKLVSNGIAIAIQVSLIFAFLTIFFFTYVSSVEKEEFGKQMDLIVDNIMKDVNDDIHNILFNQNVLSKDDIFILVNGIIDVSEEKVKISSKQDIEDIIKQNNEVKNNAIKSLGTIMGSVALVSLILLILGFCLPILKNLREALFAVFFVALTELTFLTFITKRFISADPNMVKRNLGDAIQKWIAKNHPVSG